MRYEYIIGFILILILIVPALTGSIKKIRIKRWQNQLNINKHKHIFEQLYSDIDSFGLSKQARASNDAIDYVYGEIDFVSFIALLTLAHPGPSSVFYDLGSGTGKAVIACAMVFNPKKSCGIEIFKVLHENAVLQQHRLKQLPEYAAKAPAIQFINANFLDTDFSDATHIFINATAFFGETWTALNQRLENLHSLPIVITTSKKLCSQLFMVIKTTKVQMSWGIVSAYIHQPKTL